MYKLVCELLHNININYLVNFNKDLKQYLENEQEAWSRELDDIEESFLACEQDVPPSAPQPRKKTRKRNADRELDDSKKRENPAMAELAASLQVAHFQKVHYIC